MRRHDTPAGNLTQDGSQRPETSSIFNVFSQTIGAPLSNNNKKVAGSSPVLSAWSLHVDCVCVGSYMVLELPPTVQKPAQEVNSKLGISVREDGCLSSCVAL